MKAKTKDICDLFSDALHGMIRNITLNAQGELDVDVRPSSLAKVLTFLQTYPECGFPQFVGVFVEESQKENRLAKYNLSYLLRGAKAPFLCRIRVQREDNAPLPSVSRLLSGAGWSERLAWDMFGIPFTGHADLRAALTPRFDIGPEGNRGSSSFVVGPRHEDLAFGVPLQLYLEGEVLRHLVVHPGGSLPKLECALEDVVPGGHEVRCNQASFFARLACVRALEKLAGMEMPASVRYLRVMLAEVARILAHLQSIAEMNAVLGQDERAAWVWRVHDRLLPLFLRHQAGVVVGGHASHLSETDVSDLATFCEDFASLPEELGRVSPFLRMRLAGIGVVLEDDAMEMGLSGPILRGAGAHRDLRQHDADYETLPLRIVQAVQGDCLSRHLVRVEEIAVSVGMLQHVLAEHLLDTSEIAPIPLPDVWPGGEMYEAVESAQGEAGAYVFSHGGDPSSLVLRLRIPTGFHLAALPALSEGHMLDDMRVILASLGLGGGGKQA